MLPKSFSEPMGVPAIFGKQIEIKLLHPASTEGVTGSGRINVCTKQSTYTQAHFHPPNTLS
ncbi:MAG: hypothetical protein P8X89_24005 [Reinekea sp.]